MSTLNEAAKSHLVKFGTRLNEAKHGQKKSIVIEALAYFGWDNHHKFYNELKSLGWTSGKKTRADYGSTSQSEESLRALAAVTKMSARANGKTLLETPNAISILSQNGHDFGSISNVNRLLRQRNLTAKQMKQESSHGNFRTEYPNQVHLIDPSLCVLYYPPGTKKGLRVQKYTTAAEQYKNKPEMLEKIKRLRVWRYVMVDHFSGLISVKYYESEGENQTILYDFMLWCWGKLSGSPFHGVPTNMYWDKGSAMTSKAIRNACNCLNINAVAHTTHLARAKGAVEKANDLVEKNLEGRLFLEPVHSVDELNEVAIKWQNLYNANRIPNYNAKHGRHGKARTDAWLMIMQPAFIQYLRALPSAEYCRYIFTHEPVTKQVKGNLEITFTHPKAKKTLTYSLEELHGIGAGKQVLVSPVVIGNSGNITVTVENPLGPNAIHEVEPVVFNEMGYRVNSPVFGEGFDTKKDTVIDTNQKEIDRAAYPGLTDEDIVKAKAKKTTPFNGKIDAISHLKNTDLPAAITPTGTSMELPDEFIPADVKPLSALQLKRAVMKELGRDLEEADVAFLSHYNEVFPDDVQSIVDEILRPKATPLKLVNN